MVESGEHRLRHSAERNAIGCHLFLDGGRCEWEGGRDVCLHPGRRHHPGAGNNQTLSVAFTPADTTDYATASATATINVLQATPTISWANPANIVYGTALSGTQLDASSSWTVGGVNGTVAGTFTYTPAAGTVLGAGDNQTLSVLFTPTDTTDYTTATASATINVSQATPTISWANPANIVYGTALSGTQLDASSSWTVGGVNGTVAGTFTYTPAAGTVLGAGNNQTLSVLFTPTDTTDYTTATASATINVSQATPTISWSNPANIVYGTALSGEQLDASSSWTVGGVNGTVAGTFTYTPAAGTVLGAGNNQTLSVAFTPTDTTDYTTASATATINVSQATPTISWANPANIVYGTALSGTQLDASSSWTVGGVNGTVAGTFTYTPAAGTVLGAGNNQTLSVLFTPTDTTDYTTATASATINVLQATPTITWANPADIVYGTALSATQLDASSSWTVGGVNGSVPGTFTYTPAAGTVLGAGNDQTLSVAFAPTDATDYTTASLTVTINVLPATPMGISSITPVSPNPRNAAVSTVDVTFSEPINTSSQSAGALTLTDDGGANLINNGVSLTLVSGDTYAIGGLSGLTAAQGLYTLTVNAADLKDLNGNPGTGSLSTSWLMDTTAPTSHVVNSLGASQTGDSFPVSVAFSDPAGAGARRPPESRRWISTSRSTMDRSACTRPRALPRRHPVP